MRVSPLVWAGLGLLVAALACSVGPSANSSAPMVVSSADGQAQLSISPGALPAGAKLADIHIVQLPASSDPGAPLAVYQLEPDGLVWQAPVTFTFTGAGALGALPMLSLVSGDAVEPVAEVQVDIDPAAQTWQISVPISHFSQIIVADGFFEVTLSAPEVVGVGERFNPTVVITPTGRAGSVFTTMDLNGKPKVITYKSTPGASDLLFMYSEPNARFSIVGKLTADGVLDPPVRENAPGYTNYTAGSQVVPGFASFTCLKVGAGEVGFDGTLGYSLVDYDYAVPAGGVTADWQPPAGAKPAAETGSAHKVVFHLATAVKCVADKPKPTATSGLVQELGATPTLSTTPGQSITNTVPSDTPLPTDTPAASATPTASATATPDLAPRVTKFQAEFSAPVRSTFYSVTATDPTGGELSYAWTNTNTCGTFDAQNKPIVQWLHPDEQGGCPDEPIHPGTITVVITGAGGQITCTYTGGSAPGDAAQCVKAPPP